MNKTRFYMDIAKLVAQKSKDPVTKVGSVIEKDGHILSLGYNGAPRKFPDCEIPNNNSSNDLPLIERKNTFMVHSELNSILNCGGNLTELKGSTIYVTVSPCEECAKAIAQVGIKEVVYLEEYHREERVKASNYILEKCGVKVTKYEEELIDEE